MTLVSTNIKYLRKLNGLTQEQFSQRIGIKRSLLGAYEEARANPNWNTLITIAKLFNTSVDQLLKQDLRKIRETPDLSLPMGKAGSVPRSANTPPPIFSDDADDEEVDFTTAPLISDPVMPGSGPEPQPLANVLEKYYRAPSEQRPTERTEMREARSAQTGPTPVERSPTMTGSSTVVDRGVPIQRNPSGTDEPMPVGRGTMPPQQPAFTTSYGTEPVPAFNNHYSNPPQANQVAPNPAQPDQSAQSIHYVQRGQYDEYQQRFQQPDYLTRLPTMRLPMLPVGQYRAFEADGDFLFPGAWLIGQFVRNWFDITDGQFYVLLIQHQSILARRVLNQVKNKGTLLLTADRPNVPSREVALKDVLEVWDVKAFVSQQLPPPAPSYDRIRQLADELRFEVDRLK